MQPDQTRMPYLTEPAKGVCYTFLSGCHVRPILCAICGTTPLSRDILRRDRWDPDIERPLDHDRANRSGYM